MSRKRKLHFVIESDPKVAEWMYGEVAEHLAQADRRMFALMKNGELIQEDSFDSQYGTWTWRRKP